MTTTNSGRVAGQATHYRWMKHLKPKVLKEVKAQTITVRPEIKGPIEVDHPSILGVYSLVVYKETEVPSLIYVIGLTYVSHTCIVFHVDPTCPLWTHPVPVGSVKGFVCLFLCCLSCRTMCFPYSDTVRPSVT